MRFYVVFGVLAVLALHALADESKENAPATAVAANDRSSIVSKLSAAHENNQWSLIPNSYGTALAAGGVVIVGAVALLAIAAVISPWFGYRLCHIFSTCEVPPSTPGDNFSGFSSNMYPQYRKRSIEYVGPILQALNSAYEKYGQGASPMHSNTKKINTQ
ncbi:uncharacterized protein LOC112694395 isoform X2 [Sipha flava]|uniref:Uncharacterized protein LOC112694395 isoform X2 n=1 Tax=Sipha flava TaxID=143950 RepID=A0A2S2QH06_9HEMI|nr:uncharacterized protein LOC112694395 isoform X2 [Sipha flava]